MRHQNVLHLRRSLPCMSWSPKNFYNLWRRTVGPLSDAITFQNTTDTTLFQQRWKSKAAVRAYHGDFIPEKVFKRWYLPDTLPDVRPRRKVSDTTSLEEFAKRNVREKELEQEIEKRGMAPVGSLMFSEVERRLDVFLFRCCFVHSVYEARRLIIHGYVTLNGQKHSRPNTRLAPGDMVHVDPNAMRFFKKPHGDYDDVIEGNLEKIKAEEMAAFAAILEKELEEEERIKAEKTAENAAATTENNKGDEKIEGNEEKKPEATTEEIKGQDEKIEGKEAETSITTEEIKGQDEMIEGKEAENASITTEENKGLEATTEENKGLEAAPAPEVSANDPDPDPVSTDKKKTDLTPFYLPTYASPWLFIPAYIEVSFPTCSAIYVRHPTARPGYSEIPTPYDADGALIRYAWEWYVQRRPRMRSKSQLSRMPEDRVLTVLTSLHKDPRTLPKDTKKKVKRRRIVVTPSSTVSAGSEAVQ